MGREETVDQGVTLVIGSFDRGKGRLGEMEGMKWNHWKARRMVY